METNSHDEYGLTTPAFSHDVRSQDPVECAAEKGLEILVIFTDVAGTLAALQTAERLAQKLEAHVRLLMAYEVPYALPLTQPNVPVEFLERQIRAVAGRISLKVDAQIYLCRDRKRVLSLLMPPRSLVVVGGRRRWWCSAAERLARAVQKAGHQLIFAAPR